MIRAALFALTFVSLLSAERWELKFFHDVDGESLQFTDIAFSSPERGVAAGILTSKGKSRGVALVTSDAGATWSMVRLKETPRSIYLLDDSAGWLVTEDGIWFTDEGGRNWRKIRNQDNLLRVNFPTREYGVAIGAGRTVIETRDGGKSWNKLPVLSQLKSSPDFTAFEAVDFAGAKIGTIAGSVRRRRRGEPPVPLWMDPDAPRRVQEPRLSIFLDTRDGGATWKVQTTSVFGRVIDLAFSSGTRGLALFQFDRWFAFPSEVHCINFATSKSSRCYAEKNRAITDLALTPGFALLAGFEPPGSVAWSPVPGKVKILKSVDLSKWEEMEIDYRAVATSVKIAASGTSAYAATDTGMLLKLVP
jgi:hypothetical protein